MFVILWKFAVKEGQETDFERVYGPEGDWVRLFGKGQGFVGTELLRSSDQPSEFVTADRWRSQGDFEKFRGHNLDAYKAVDEQCADFTHQETLLGMFNTIGGEAAPATQSAPALAYPLTPSS